MVKVVVDLVVKLLVKLLIKVAFISEVAVMASVGAVAKVANVVFSSGDISLGARLVVVNSIYSLSF